MLGNACPTTCASTVVTSSWGVGNQVQSAARSCAWMWTLNVCTRMRACPVRFDRVYSTRKDPLWEKKPSASFWSNGSTFAPPRWVLGGGRGAAVTTIGCASHRARIAVMPYTGGGRVEEEAGRQGGRFRSLCEFNKGGPKLSCCPFFREGFQIQFSPFGKFRTGRAIFFRPTPQIFQIGPSKPSHTSFMSTLHCRVFFMCMCMRELVLKRCLKG